MENYKPTQLTKSIVHQIRCELQKYSSCNKLVELENFKKYFISVTNRYYKLLHHKMTITDEYIIVIGYFEGTEMTWRVKRTI